MRSSHEARDAGRSFFNAELWHSPEARLLNGDDYPPLRADAPSESPVSAAEHCPWVQRQQTIGRHRSAIDLLVADALFVREWLEDQRVTTRAPTIVVWTDHALAKAQLLGIGLADVEDAVLADHEKRTRNTGAADWLLRSGRLAIAYNYPDDDYLAARVVTLWRQR